MSIKLAEEAKAAALERARNAERVELMDDEVASSPDGDSALVVPIGSAEVAVVAVEHGGSPTTAPLRPRQQRSASALAEEAKRSAKARARHPVPGHTVQACASFEETPRVKAAAECVSCGVYVPAEEVVEQTASCRCVKCAAIFCYGCAIQRLPEPPTADHPFLLRLPPPQPKERRVVLTSPALSSFLLALHCFFFIFSLHCP